ncbi:MAG: helix-turn-helix domain-containing protein [Ruminococcus sp.]|nr:helix-turn-helix domain-containing protein [Ruminococcus sp.]MCM1382856.1 helix-turn-helix domain-containing protein [Muribaculaceae bacterium]MCM1478714.1 helix-turn-helix domain-containing protein [Muribaculaceae bacterium]
MSYSREELSYMVGARIREYRTQTKISQENLALTSNVHPDFLGKLERGERCPSIDTLYKLCCGLKITMPQLLDFDSDTAHTNAEAQSRIAAALEGLTADEAVQIAEFVENIVKFKYEK